VVRFFSVLASREIRVRRRAAALVSRPMRFLNRAGRDGGDARGFVEGLAQVGDVEGLGRAVGVSAKLDDVGMLVVGGPHPAGRDGEIDKAVDVLAQVHLEGLEGDAVGAVTEAGVEFILQGHERLDVAGAGVFKGHGGVLDMDQGDLAEGVCAFGGELGVGVALPAVMGDDLQLDGIIACGGAGKA